MPAKGSVNPEVQKIMEERGVTNFRAYKIYRTMMAEHASEGADHSLANRITDVLKNGSVKDIDELRQALFFKHEDMSASPMEITKAIWSLQKRGLVTFYERKNGRDSLLTRIKLTRNAMKDMGIIPTPDHTRPSTVKPSRELKRPSPVGKDMTDPERHHYIAKGGEVERTVDPERADNVVKARVQAATLPIAIPIKRPAEPPRANEKAPTDEELRREFASQYPLITEILGRASKYQSYVDAAKALEGVDDELALELLGKVDLTPLEKEVIRYVGEN